MTRTLGRVPPPDWEHVEKYPLTAPSVPVAPTPVVIGINWYDAFDHPERLVLKGSSADYWIGRGDLGAVRGGHCVCLEPGAPEQDSPPWRVFYNQGEEGACVGFGWSRCMSLLNRKKYDGFWLYKECKKRDGHPDQEGTWVRTGGEVLVQEGHVRVVKGEDQPPRAADGIVKFRWARSADEVLRVLNNPKATKLGAVPILNSWGRSYPQRVWLPAEKLDRLIKEDGEIAVPTDR